MRKFTTPRLGQTKSTVGFFGMKAKTIGVLTLVVVTIVFLIAAWRIWTRPIQPADYEGRIVDRWADNGGAAESYQPRLALLIESNDGRRFTVRVDPNVYEAARVGMRIKSRSGQVVLIDQNSSSNR